MHEAPTSEKSTNTEEDNLVKIACLALESQKDEGKKIDGKDQHGVSNADEIPSLHQNQFQEQSKDAVSSVNEITIDENLHVLKYFTNTKRVGAMTDDVEMSADQRAGDNYKMKIVFDLSRKSHPASADGLLPTPDCPEVKITRLAPDSALRQCAEPTVRSDSQTRKLKRKPKENNITFSQDIPDYKGYESIEDVLSFINGKNPKEEKPTKTCEKSRTSRVKREKKDCAKPDETSEDNSDRESFDTERPGREIPESDPIIWDEDLFPRLPFPTIPMPTNSRYNVLADDSQHIGNQDLVSFCDRNIEREDLPDIDVDCRPFEAYLGQQKAQMFSQYSRELDAATIETNDTTEFNSRSSTNPALVSLSLPLAIQTSKVIVSHDEKSLGEELPIPNKAENLKTSPYNETKDKWIESLNREHPVINSDVCTDMQDVSETRGDGIEAIVRPDLHEPGGITQEKVNVDLKSGDQAYHQPRGRRNYRGGWMDAGHSRLPSFQQPWSPRLAGQDFSHGWHQGLRFPGQGVTAEHLAVPFPAVLHPHRMQALQQTLMPVSAPAAPLPWKQWRKPTHTDNRLSGRVIQPQEERLTHTPDQPKKKKRNSRRNGKEQSKKEDTGTTEPSGSCVLLDRGDSVHRPVLSDMSCNRQEALECANREVLCCSHSLTGLHKSEDTAVRKSAFLKKPLQTQKKCSQKPVYVHDKRVEEIEPLDIGIVFGWDPSLDDCQSRAGNKKKGDEMSSSAHLHFRTELSPRWGARLHHQPDERRVDPSASGAAAALHSVLQPARSASFSSRPEPVPTSSSTSIKDGFPSVCASQSDSATSFSAKANEGLVLVEYGSKVPLGEGETRKSRQIYYQHFPDGPYDRKFVEDMAATLTSLWELATSGNILDTYSQVLQFPK